MSEAHESAKARMSEQMDAMFDCIRGGLEAFSDAITPPESASRHFRQARIEVLRGVREMIDHGIENLSRDQRV
ncbi:MAG: hypothetical protein WB992_26610 [Bryobacteraceae bacterium]